MHGTTKENEASLLEAIQLPAVGTLANIICKGSKVMLITAKYNM